MRTYADIEAMDISEGGKLVGLCTVHLLKYMKAHNKTIDPTTLIKKLEEEADTEGIPFSRGSYTRRESYKAAYTSCLSNGFIRRGPSWTVEYVEEE